jgi:DNA-binding NtrC family response regulator
VCSSDLEGFSEGAVQKLVAHNWPGNVRQLRSVIRRAVLVPDRLINEGHLDIADAEPPVPKPAQNKFRAAWKEVPLKELVRQGTEALEREVIREVLKHTGGNKARAARILKVDYKTIFSKVKHYGIQSGGDTDDER